LTSPFAEFIARLLGEGCAFLKAPPQHTPAADAEVLTLLEAAYATYRLGVAGPPIPFDGRTALAAAAVVYRACWFVVDHSLLPEHLAPLLQMPCAPGTPAQHLSADLVLRFLPQVHRRAAAVDAAEPLTCLLADVLRRWPLSGALAEVEGGPLNGLDFGGHPGLLWLYAERWAQREKLAWLPAGAGREYLEAVSTDMGRNLNLLPLGDEMRSAS
jgi:hypothetical protein